MPFDNESQILPWVEMVGFAMVRTAHPTLRPISCFELG